MVASLARRSEQRRAAGCDRLVVDAVEGLGDSGDDLEDRRGGEGVLKTYGIGAQILRDLGLSKIRVLSAPKHMYAISGFDLEITEYVEE